MKSYLGSVVLNGPAGAADTPEMFVPRSDYSGVPTVCALPIEATADYEAQAKQILWHALSQRIQQLEWENTVTQYNENKQAALRQLLELQDAVLTDSVRIQEGR